MKYVWFLVLLLVANDLWAVTWDELPAAQQQALATFESQWDTLPLERRQRLSTGAARWLGLDDAERARLTQRFERWQALPAERRATLRQRFETFQQSDRRTAAGAARSHAAIPTSGSEHPPTPAGTIPFPVAGAACPGVAADAAACPAPTPRPAQEAAPAATLKERGVHTVGLG